MHETAFSPSSLIPEPTTKAHMRTLLRSHSQPPDHLASTISALSNELARYYTEKRRLQAQLEKVTSEYDALDSYYRECRSLLSPIRRLPSEILVKIFTLFCSDPWPAIIRSSSPMLNYPVEDAMVQLAQGSLLTLSQVCARWHSICLGTPTLWANIQIHNVLWSTPASTSKMMSLLEAAFDRGASSPLSIALRNFGAVPHIPALELLAAYSERWQTAFLICPASDLRHFSSVKGRLPRLQMLAIWGASSLDIFEDAPHLTEVETAGVPRSLTALTHLPLHQLHSLRCLEFVGAADLLGLGVSPAMNLMSRLPKTATFRLQLRRSPRAAAFNEFTSVPPVTAEIDRLLVDVAKFSPSNVGLLLAKIVDSLTLPGLKALRIESKDSPPLPLPWAHTQFLGLAARSSFHTHLQSLDVYHSVMTETELIDCLSILPCLKRLAISDHQIGADGGADQLLITNTLLTHLTSHSTCPVPHLRSLRCRSLLQFDDKVFLKFLLSRLDAVGSFNSEIRCLSGHRRDFDPSVVARIGELRAQKSLAFSLT